MAVLFGGRSSEHEISVITALQAIQAMDPVRYAITPVYISTTGKWYTGAPLLDKSFYRKLPAAFSQVTEVTLLPDPTYKGLLPITAGRSNKQAAKFQDIIPIDICFLAFHGQFGEDGCMQGLLELADIPYTGCAVTASAIAMHKYHCKVFLQAHGIPTLPSLTVAREKAAANLSQTCADIMQTAGLAKFPLFIKPCHLGSSIGISMAHDIATLHAGLAKAFIYDDEAIIEPYIGNLMEINVAVLDGTPPIASVVEIPRASGVTLTYEDKYLRGGKKTGGASVQGMASLTRDINPAHLDPAIKNQVIEYALKSFELLKCRGVSRFDFMVDKSTGKLYFNELNIIPGSLAFYLWEQSTPPLLYTEVINRLLERAKHHKSQQLALQRTIGFKAL